MSIFKDEDDRIQQFIEKSVIISSGASISGLYDLGGKRLSAIILPSSWTTANLTFQAGMKDDGSDIADVYDSAGNELTVIASASRAISDIPELSSFRFIKIRSGTSATPVNQGGDRTINLILN